jgi:hypothetical protein
MPFDPALPAANSPNSSAQMRDQLNGLKDLIDLALAGGVTGAQVDAVNTVPPGNPAGVSLSFSAGVLHFSFSLPQGADGTAGAPGSIINGAQVDSVATLNPGDAATAGASYDGSLVRFSFGIPRGADGTNGAPGSVINGAQVDSVATLNPGDAATAGASYDGSLVRFSFGIPRGADGTPAPPPEVTLPMLDAAIAGSSANTNVVGTLDTPFADPDAEALRQKLNELLLAARR